MKFSETFEFAIKVNFFVKSEDFFCPFGLFYLCVYPGLQLNCTRIDCQVSCDFAFLTLNLRFFLHFILALGVRVPLSSNLGMGILLFFSFESLLEPHNCCAFVSTEIAETQPKLSD